MLEFLVPARIQNSPFLYIHSTIPSRYLHLSLSNFLRRPPAAPGAPPAMSFSPSDLLLSRLDLRTPASPGSDSAFAYTTYYLEYHIIPTYDVCTIFGFPSPPPPPIRHQTYHTKFYNSYLPGAPRHLLLLAVYLASRVSW